jgi:hypothetical protein
MGARRAEKVRGLAYVNGYSRAGVVGDEQVNAPWRAQEESAMHRFTWLVGGAVVTVALWAPGVGAQDVNQDRRSLYTQDNRDIRQDRPDVARDLREVRQDEREIAQDRHRLRQDMRAGDWRAVAADRAELRKDRRDLFRDRQELARDERELRHDLQDRNRDRRER